MQSLLLAVSLKCCEFNRTADNSYCVGRLVTYIVVYIALCRHNLDKIV